MTVVIPTGQYANIQPTVTGVGDTFEEAQADALRKAASFYDNVEAQAQLKLTLPSAPKPVIGAQYQQLKCWFDGTTVMYDDAAHRYVDESGVEYMSGSRFAKQFEHDFPKDAILPGYAERYKVRESEVEGMWEAKGDASTTFGTAMHQALETYGKYWKIAEACGKDPLEMIPATLRPAVAAFFTDERKTEDALYELIAIDGNKHRCGQLDRVVIVDRENKILDIEDYKTNSELFKVETPKTLKAPYSHLPNMAAARYTIQLSFYKAIVESKGWKVRSIKLHHWNGLSEPGQDATWETIELRPESVELSPIDVSKIM